MTPRRTYPTDLSDARWALIEPVMSAWRAERAQAGHDLLRGRVREQAGRAAEPTAAIIDAQVVKASSNVPEASQGYDAGKKTKGRKRHIATDTLGLLLALVITAASVQDTNGGKQVTEQLAEN